MAKVTLQPESAPVAAAGQDSDRRKSERTELVVRIDYSTVDELFTEFTRDINEGGLFIETGEPHTPGTEVTLQFALPGTGESVTATGTVVWTTAGDDSRPSGMGIEFDDLTSEARARIDVVVRSLRASRA